jgi:superoxide reductase
MKLADVITDPGKEGKEKHVPHIEAPKKVKAGARFEVKVTVGKEVPHPNLVEHHIKWVQLFAKEDGQKPVVQVASADFAPTMGEPITTFTLILQKSCELIALEHCNIHGLWDNSVKIEVE